MTKKRENTYKPAVYGQAVMLDQHLHDLVVKEAARRCEPGKRVTIKDIVNTYVRAGLTKAGAMKERREGE